MANKMYLLWFLVLIPFVALIFGQYELAFLLFIITAIVMFFINRQTSESRKP